MARTSAQLPLDPIGNQQTPPAPPPEAGATQVSPGKGDKEVTLNVQQTDLRTVLAQLSQYSGLNILATKSVQGLVSASLSNVGVDAALEAILRTTGFVARREGDFVYVGTRQELDEIEQAREGIGVRVYRPNYVTAGELQNLITPMLTKSIGATSVSSAAETGIASDDDSAGGDSFAGAEALLVRDYETVLTQIDRIVAEVDARPLQVAIEATILEVKLDDEDKVGVNFELLRDKSHARLVSGMPLTDLANMDITKTAGLKFGFLDSSLGAFLDALETVGDANVVASPSLLCLNKQRAEIHIGSEIGYITTTVTETVATESVEYLEVGTQLRLRPFISSDGMIRLELHPELSSGQVDANGLPDKDLTQVTTNVLVPDGRTVIIGGLIHENLETTTTQIPLLGNLPLVGVAFRQKTEKVGRSEIIVLVTPRIVSGSQIAAEGETSAYQYLQRQAIYADKMSPLGKRYDGRRYLRLAQSAWINGHAQTALKYVNLAIHFDPLNLQAVTLRDQIIAAGIPDTATVDTRLREGLAPWGHPLHTERLPAGVLEDLARPAMAGQHAEVFDADPTDPAIPGGMEIIEPGKIEAPKRKKE